MKWCLMAVAMMLCVSAPAAEKFFIVKNSGYDRNTGFSIKSEAELKKIQAEITTETSLRPKAIENSKKAWKQDEDFGKKPFPASSISKRKCEAVGTPFPSKEKAEAKRSELAARESDMTAKKTQRDAAKVQSMKTDERNKAEALAKEKANADAKAVEVFEQELARVKAEASKK